ncbi:MAG: class I SAM-dependent methyltransferase [Bacteroidales bacterium]|nr:class I SAM-dependent methyltransferase [Bacteroidales bacterium]
MTNERLLQHYNHKYKNEEYRLDFKNLKILNVPSNRHEGLMYYFPKFFKGGNILEIGGGDGLIAYSLYNQIKFNRYLITDLSDIRVTGLSKRFSELGVFTFRQLDVEIFDKSLEDSFDAIIMIALIEHLIDPIRTLENLNKYLKTEGFIYIETPNIAKYTHRLKLLAGKFPSTASINQGLLTYNKKPVDLFDEGHLHYFTFYSLKALLKRTGFKRIKTIPIFHTNIKHLKRIGHFLAKLWPEMFSDLVLIAYK